MSAAVPPRPTASPARDEVDRIVEEELSAIEHSPVQDFLLVLTERAAKKRLKRGAKRD